MSSSWNDVATSIGAGLTRSLAGFIVVEPINTVKIHCQQQRRNPALIARDLLQDSPAKLYEGGSYALGKKITGQMVAWPIMLHGHKVLQNCGMDTNAHPILTETVKAHMIIGCNMAMGSAELDRKRIETVTKTPTSWGQVLLPHLAKNSVNWTTFLVAQDQYRKLYHRFTEKEKLTLEDQTLVGTATAATVGFVGSLTDRWQTLAITEKATLSQVRKTRNPQAAFLNILALEINNLFSIYWLEYFSENRSKIAEK